MFKSILHTIQNVYSEKYEVALFTMGFELEGYTQDYQDLEYFCNNFFKSAKTLGGHNGKAKGDGSLDNYQDEDETDFEWESPVFYVTPQNIGLIIQFLKKVIKSRKIRIDETCGFHIHIKFPNAKAEELGPQMMWVIMNLVADTSATGTQAFKNILRFKDIQLYQDTYASVNDFFALRNSLINYELFTGESKSVDADILRRILKAFYKREKYRILKIHEQGTLEWRGSRGFLNNGRALQDITDFMTKALYPFVSWISNAIAKTSLQVGGVTFRRDAIYKILSQMKSPVDVETNNDDSMFHFKMTRELKREIMRKFVWLRPNNATYRGAYIDISDDGKPIFVCGLWEGGTWKDGIFAGHFLNGEIDGGIFIDVNSWPTDLGISGSAYHAIDSPHSSGVIGAEYGGNPQSVIVNQITAKRNVHFNDVKFADDARVSYIEVNAEFRRSIVNNAECDGVEFYKGTIIKNSKMSHSRINECEAIDSTLKDVNIEESSKVFNCNMEDCRCTESIIKGGTIELSMIENSTCENVKSTDCYIKNSEWINGECIKSKFVDGRWMSGTFNGDKFINSVWHDGTWLDGSWLGNSYWCGGKRIVDGKELLTSPDNMEPLELEGNILLEDIKNNPETALRLRILNITISDDGLSSDQSTVRRCEICNGTGKVKNKFFNKYTTCHICFGIGQTVRSASTARISTCPRCSGEDENCPYCTGTNIIWAAICPLCRAGEYVGFRDVKNKYHFNEPGDITTFAFRCPRCGGDGTVPLLSITTDDEYFADKERFRALIASVGEYGNIKNSRTYVTLASETLFKQSPEFLMFKKILRHIKQND